MKYYSRSTFGYDTRTIMLCFEQFGKVKCKLQIAIVSLQVLDTKRFSFD